MPDYSKYIIIIVSILLLLLILTRIGLFSGSRPTNLGVTAGKLAACPETPNCVSSQASDAQHAIEPLSMTGTLEEEHKKLLALIKGFPLVNIVVDKTAYIHVEFNTGIMMYTDDVEFWFDEDSGYIHFRSASRLGAYDFGLNRRRMEGIRSKWTLSH